MYRNRTCIAIIPARGGSKGLPGKNVRMLCGRPLIGWSIMAGLNSGYVDEVTVTTDSEDIAGVAREYGAAVPFLRPTELAADDSPTVDAVTHALEFYKSSLGKEYDYVVLLEPTSPLRDKGDIDRMMEKLVDNESEYDSIVSIGKVNEHPSIMKKIVGNTIQPYCEELNMTTRRQDNPAAYFPYGVAYIVKTTALLAEKTFYTRRSTYYEILRYQNYEIDDLYDFLAVENIMKHEWGL